MKYIIIDGALSGTGIRDKYNGGYVSPESISLSPELILKLNNWLSNYENEHYNGYNNADNIKKLDNEGLDLVRKIKIELKDVKVEYFSDALLKMIIG